MAAIPSFKPDTLEELANVLGDTSSGLTGSEIGRYLRELGFDDPLPGMTKRVRLLEAFRLRQQSDRCANNICAFIQRVMSPVRHVGGHEYFETKRREVNRILAFEGLHLAETGTIGSAARAATISDAEAAASRLRKALLDRSVHPDVLAFCRSELLADNYFHAVLEASKSVAQKIRDLSGLTGDGAPLVDAAFAKGKKTYPVLAFNSLRTESEESEPSGLMNLMKGFFGTFRNPTAHAPKVTWNMTEQDALDILTVASLLHRRLDSAVRTGA